MLHPDLVKAQASTLREWADAWEQDSLDNGTEGAAEVAFLLRRTATHALSVVGAPVPVAATREDDPPKTVPVEELREG